MLAGIVLGTLFAGSGPSHASASAMASVTSSVSLRVLDVQDDDGLSLPELPAGFEIDVIDPAPPVTELVFEAAGPGSVTFGGSSTATEDGVDSAIDAANDFACTADPGGTRDAAEDAFNFFGFKNDSDQAVTVILEFVTSFSISVSVDRPAAFAEIALDIAWPLPALTTGTIVNCPGGGFADRAFAINRTIVAGAGVGVAMETFGPDTCQIAVRVPIYGPNFGSSGAVGTLAFCRATVPDLDHFVTYKTKITKGEEKFVKFGPVVLTDQFGNAGYDIKKPLALGVPGDKNGEGILDPVVHLTEYQVKAAKGEPRFVKREGIRIVNQCNDLVLEVKKPTSLMVPTGKDLSVPATVPDPGSHDVDHFLCYKAKPQRKAADGTKLPKFPKGIQVEVVDQFQTRRYDLKGVTKLCNPTDKAGSPVFLSGPFKGDSKPITPATIGQPGSHLVCYKATPAKKTIAQQGCGPLVVGDKGVKIAPKQPKHTKRTGVFFANQLDAGRLDTKKELEICIPSAKLLG